MLDDREQRLLDATEVLLGRDDPELAASLREHRLPSRRTRSPRVARTRRRRLPRLPRGFWPPTVMFLVCLLLVVVPALVLEVRAGPPPAGVVHTPARQPDPR